MLKTNKENADKFYEFVKEFHSLETLPEDLPSPQHRFLIPELRPYQVKAVKWMLYKELFVLNYQPIQEEDGVILPKGGILADEMGLGKTIEVLACILANPKKVYTAETNEHIDTSSQVLEIPTSTLVTDELSTTREVTILECKEPSIQRTPKVETPIGVHNDIQIEEHYSFKRKRKTSTQLPVGKQIEEGDLSTSTTAKRRRVDSKSTTDNSIGDPSQTNQVSKRGGGNYKVLKAWYESCLAETSPRETRKIRTRNSSNLQCCCVSEVCSELVVQCLGCGTWQHSDCVGYDPSSAEYEYFCFRCWSDKPLVPSAGTVIISPEAISQQWACEIEKHTMKGHLKVLVYEGVRVTGYIQPHDLAAYDIVITTYQVLTRELNYTMVTERNLRHAKRFFAPTTPLLFVEWWRLCLDEAQMVEGASCRAADMAKKFTTVHKWAITGTPVQRAIDDLKGLLEFIAGTDCRRYYELVSQDWRSFIKSLPRLLWRTQMKDVLEEAGVPPQTVQTHQLQFSSIEKYFYQSTQNACAQQFLGRISKFNNLNATLKSLDRKKINSLLNPLLKLRQACLHPQAVRGKFVTFKKTMTMEDLVIQMVADAKLDAENCLRHLVKSINGTAALYIIKMEWKKAVEAYRTVLHLEQEYNGRLKIDSLQKIHAMHNLAEVLDGGHTDIPPTLRDETLRQDVGALEQRYLANREAPMKATEEHIEQHSKQVADSLERAPAEGLSYSNWFLNVLEWSTDEDDLLYRLKAAIELPDHKQKNQFNNLANKLKSLYIVRVELAKWLADLDQARENVVEWVKQLQNADKDNMACEALTCHLSPNTLAKTRIRCTLCKAESAFQKYEALLFEETSKKKRKNNRILDGNSREDTNDLDNREIANLIVNVNTFKASEKGGFKASPFELILRALAAYGKQKSGRTKWNAEAKAHLTLLGKVKKEFFDLNLMWRQINNLVDAKDELNMCKTRLRLPFPDEEDQMQMKKKEPGSNLIIMPCKVDQELFGMEHDVKYYEYSLKKQVGTLSYLQTLQKEGVPYTICPVCRADLIDKWAVLECGHCICLDCLTFLQQHSAQSLLCPQCRHKCLSTSVSYVENDPSSGHSNGLYSTKVSAVVNQALHITQQDPATKILVFSQWEKVLDLLMEAFEANKITFRRLKSGKLNQRKCIKEFKERGVNVLLLPLRSGAKGLNLVEATHVFLVEPILNPADELQAVSRVHRIGQTRPTVVHRFIVCETIEERILTAMAKSGVEQWADDCLTLRNLNDLFNNDSNNLDNIPTQAQSSSSSSIPVSDSELDTIPYNEENNTIQ